MSEDLSRGNLVVVAHSEERLRTSATTLLRAAGFEVVAVEDGASAQSLLRNLCPSVLVAGVALRAPAFYELCTLIADENIATRVVIISSVHTVGAYKRPPSNLYGADAAIDEHRLTEELVALVSSLCAL